MIQNDSRPKFGTDGWRGIIGKDFNSKKAKSFRAAYAGARLYLLISVITKKFKIEIIYFFLEETFRKTKFKIKNFISWYENKTSI